MRRISALLMALLLLAAILPSIASADAVPDIVFSDAWFGDLGTRIEAAPGDRNVQLVVELLNGMDEPIRYVEGTLHLPEGFRDAKTGGRITAQSISRQVQPGQLFYLTFLLNIAEDAEIGEHEASLALRYVEWDEDTYTITHVKIRFRVTGRSILEPALSVRELKPGEPETLELEIKNSGSAEASSTEIWIEPGSPGLAILEGGGRHFLGNLMPGGSAVVPLRVLAARSLADSTTSVVITITYLNPYGFKVQETHRLSLRVKPMEGVGVVLDVSLENPILEPSRSSSLTIRVANRGREPARDVNVEIGLPQLPNPPLTLQEGALSVKLGDLEPGAEKSLSVKVFVNELASGKSYSIPVTIAYADEEGRHLIQKGLTITVLEESARNRLRIYSTEYVRGGLIEEANITIENISGGDLEDVTITISPTVSWVTLLGPTTWNIPKLANGEVKVIKLKIYVPSETAAGSTIGEPFNLRVDASFREPGGGIRSENHLLGMYVEGIIEMKLQELSIERLGGDLLLVGRLLNEGTEKASYTEVRVAGGDIQSERVSYLGDVEPNAPILFNIPIERLAKSEGRVKVVLKVTYLNSLRERGEDVIEAFVEAPGPSAEASEVEQPPIWEQLPAMLLIAAVVVAAIAIYAVRRSRRVESS